MRVPNIRRILLLTILMVFCLHDSLNFVAPPPGAIVLASGPGHQRSIDLAQYGFHLGERGNQYDYISTAQVAASQNLGAVAMNKLSPTSRIEKPNGYLEALWDVFLLIFDAKSGKLTVKAGPWTGGFGFELFSTSQGNFLLHLWDYHAANEGERKGEALLLISPSGEQLKELDLAPPVSGRCGWRVQLSPSGKKLLLSSCANDHLRYEILDANTLSKQSEWDGTISREIVVVSISDNQLLGESQSAGPNGTTVTNKKCELFLRTVEGAWSPIRTSSCGWALLSDSLVANVEQIGDQYKDLTSGYRLVVARTDGSTLLSQTIQKNHSVTYASGPLVTSPDGRRLAIPTASMSTLWLWRTLDMGPENFAIYVWEVPNPAPLLKEKVGGPFAHYSFSPDGASIFIADRQTLKMIPVRGK